MRTPRFLRYFLLLLAMLAVPASSFAGVFVSVNIAPPILPVYEQPLCPGDGYIWTPGYWAYSPDGGYYWVPGAWVLAPYTGALWTPGYWGYGDGGAYFFHSGYWGLHIGFYGGVNYGYGYFGQGYEGGYWNHGAFTYNRTINHIDINRVHNVYERNVDRGPENRASFNGGNGIHAEPTANERVAEHEQHLGAVPLQQQHERAAAGNRAQFANVNHGNPAVTATQRPGAQAFHQAMAHPNNAEAVQAAHNAPRTQNGGGFQNNARPAGNTNRPAATNQPQARPQQEARPQTQAQPHTQMQQSRPAPQARPAAPQQQARPQGGGGGGESHGGGGESHGGGGGGQPHGEGRH